MTARLSLLLALIFASPLAAPAAAQSIEVGQLDEARAFAPGIDLSRGLEPSAWQGTSAPRATRLIRAIDSAPRHPVARDMLRRVVLGGLAVPDGGGEAFEQVRIRAAQILATPEEYARFSARNPSANDPRLRADARLAAGDLMGACQIGEQIADGRGESYWVRLRRACLLERGETAAAELAGDILRERGEPVELSVGARPEGFWAEVAARDGDGLNQYLSNLAIEGMDISQGILFDLEVASADTGTRGSAQLYQLALQGDALATARFVARARAAGLDPDAVLSKIDAVLSPNAMAAADLMLFARHAVVTRDLGLLQALYSAVDDDAARQRLALASDALGGGFYARPLGDGLEQGLADKVPLAVHDALIAVALGAELSEAAETGLADITLGAQSNDWIAIQAAMDRSARAETLLRLAPLVASADGPAERYRVIRALRVAGFNDVAGQAAALAFLDAG